MEVMQVPPVFNILNKLNVSKSDVLFDFLIARGNAGKPVHYQGRQSTCIPASNLHSRMVSTTRVANNRCTQIYKQDKRYTNVFCFSVSIRPSDRNLQSSYTARMKC